ncbi:MAG TPA: hypothetical protein H9835_07600 [Candidatus Agathobaculum merdigallinarum]|nr:hypothetical protein [Candidatus Agathobaculum merdigallinarum]
MEKGTTFLLIIVPLFFILRNRILRLLLHGADIPAASRAIAFVSSGFARSAAFIDPALLSGSR